MSRITKFLYLEKFPPTANIEFPPRKKKGRSQSHRVSRELTRSPFRHLPDVCFRQEDVLLARKENNKLWYRRRTVRM